MKNFTSLAFSIFLAGVVQMNAQTIFSENFNSSSGTNLPSGWSQETAASDGGFNIGSTTALSSQYFPIPAIASNSSVIGTNDDDCNCDKGNEILMTPSMDLSTTSGSVFLKFLAFYIAGTYNNIPEIATVEASTDGGTTWSVIETLAGSGDWQNVFIDISSYAGSSNFMLGFRYKDGGVWNYGLVLDDISVYQPVQNEIELSSIALPAYGAINPATTISGTIFNAGSSAITSFDASYTVNGGAPVSGTISGVNVAPLTSYNFNHTTNWSPASPGTYTIELSVSNPNGNADGDNSNNTLSDDILIASQTVQRTPLIEEFSSNTCPPCASFNATFIPLLISNNSNTPNGNFAVVKYQMNYPSPGTDVSYNNDSEVRSAFYGVPGIPDPYIDGFNMQAANQAELDAYASQPAIMSLSIDASTDGASLTASATVTPYANFPAGLKLYIAVTEDFYEDSGTNGETEFHFVQRKLLPNGSGNTLTALTDGTPVTVTKSANFTFGNVAQGNYNLWSSDFSNITVVAWVQDPSSRFIFQAAIDADALLSAENQDAQAFKAKFFPNPSRDVLNIKLNNAQKDETVLEVHNLFGQKVDVVNFGNTIGDGQTVQYNTSNLSDGVYLFTIASGSNRVSSKIIVTH